MSNAVAEENALKMELAEIVPEYYSQSGIVQWLFHRRLKSALAFLKRFPAASLLDAGCGDGSFMQLIASDDTLKALHATGLDINPRITSLKNAMPHYSFVVGSLLKMDLPDESFDTVVSLDVLEHFENADVPVGEIRRVLKKGGHFITSEPVESLLYKSLRFLLKGTFSQESGPGSSPHHYNARGIDQVVRAAGFIRLESKKIPLPTPLDLFHINLYEK